MKTRLVLIAVVALTAWTVLASSPGDANIVPKLKDSVKDNWGKINALSGRAMALRAEMEGLPDKAWFGSDKESSRALIHDNVMRIRKLLLTTDSQELMKKVDALDKRIADIDHDIHVESAKDVFSPTRDENSALKKLREKRNRLVREREDSVRVVLMELASLGLKLSNGSEQCLFVVDARDLIDAVVVAKSVGIVVDTLRELMETGDVASAKRYFGTYLVMVEVQKACFDMYLEKSRTGQWREKLSQIESDADFLRKKAACSAKSKSFSEHQRAAFARNAEVNATTLKAAREYIKMLAQHESVIQAKADEAAKMLLLADNSYRTMALTDEFLSLVQSSQDSFEALLQLQLPPIEFTDDAALQAEFSALTQRLKD